MSGPKVARKTARRVKAATKTKPTYSLEERRSLEGQVVQLALSGRLAQPGLQAAQSQRQHGLAVTLQSGSCVIKIYPDGKKEVLGRVRRPKYTLPKTVEIVK